MSESAVTVRSVPMAELAGLSGPIGTSNWLEITQDMINTFAEVTRDQQWIHIDPERAKEGPFGTTIAHGFLTLSLASSLLWDVLEVPDAKQVVNYGLNKVRFVGPVPAGSRIRAAVAINAVEEVKGGLQALAQLTYEREGAERPVCVAELVFRYYA